MPDARLALALPFVLAACTGKGAGALADGGMDASADGRGGAGACELRACGGDARGAWSFADFCYVDPPDPFDGDTECPASRAGPSVRMTGTLSIEDGGAYALDATTELLLTISYPTECLATQNCDARSVGDWTCTSGASCDCTSVSQRGETHETGAWRAVDGLLTLEPEGGGRIWTIDYCVEDAELRGRVDVADPMEVGAVLTFARQ